MSQLTPTMPAACQAAAQKAVAQHKATGNTSEYEDSNEPCQNQICKGSNRNAATSCVPGQGTWSMPVCQPLGKVQCEFNLLFHAVSRGPLACCPAKRSSQIQRIHKVQVSLVMADKRNLSSEGACTEQHAHSYKAQKMTLPGAEQGNTGILQPQ